MSIVDRVEALQKAAPDVEPYREKIRKRGDAKALKRHIELLSATKPVVMAGEVRYVPDNEARGRAIERQWRANGVATPPPAASLALALALGSEPAQ